MKKLFVLLLLLPLCFSACSSDDDDDVKYGGDVVGTWNYRKTTVKSIKTDSKELTEIIKRSFAESDILVESSKFTFNADGTVIETAVMDESLVPKTDVRENQVSEISSKLLTRALSRMQKANVEIEQNGTYTTSNGYLKLMDEYGDSESVRYRVAGNELIIEFDVKGLMTEALHEEGIYNFKISELIIEAFYVKQ